MTTLEKDNAYMARAMELARLGLGSVSPNPMVGCVIVADEKIIGEGFHMQYGGPHAEVHAVNSVKEKRHLKDSTVYVNLEPCAHFGKTPPCATLLVDSGVKKVVIANVDPNPLVAGKGISILQKAGIETVVGTMETEGRELNRRFFTYMEQQRPYVILKWAVTADGFIAKTDFSSKWISNELSRKLVHKWRTEEDAILVGKNTARYDNPMLNARHWPGKNPVRIVIDRNLELPKNLNIFNKEIPTLCYNMKLNRPGDGLDFIQLSTINFLQHLLADLHKRNIQSLIVEGGAAILQAFIDEGLWDEARVFQAPFCFGDGIRAPQLRYAQFEGKETIMDDTLTWFRRS